MVFSCIYLVPSPHPILDQGNCSIQTIFLLIFYTMTLTQWNLLRHTHSFVTDPFHSINLETAEEAIADGLQLLSAVYFFLAFSVSPSFSLSSVKPLCWIFIFFSFFPLCLVYILYEDLQTGNLNE